ncbi:MAG: NADH-quinone oxidoreductase subunit NuoF [Planctomycetes bacterium]|nr:NADH-quinone oxidoreductase subunit NuoF [Planctomycetota bacterium]
MGELYLFNRIQKPGYRGTLAEYAAEGGYAALRKALAMTPEEVVAIVKDSGLRGRGGAGFPTGFKWTFMPKPNDPRARYLAVNADESEPGTCKDRILMERDPHFVLEGILISAYAIRAKAAYIYIRGEYRASKIAMDSAIAEARAAGIINEKIMAPGLGAEVPLLAYTHVGAGAYICGEETALMESLEGKRGQPRPKPPFPANFGLWGMPTTVNNIETLANVPPIITKGVAWYQTMGTKPSPGNFLCGVSGDVNKPGVYELPLGIPIKSIINDVAGGVWKGRALKGIIPGGSSSGFLPKSIVDGGIAMDHDSLKNQGSFIGTASVVVFDETRCIVRAVKILCQFYHHETCGQCTQCREGCAWLDQIICRIENGDGREDDITTLLALCDGMRGKTICALSDAAAIPVQLALQHFRAEFEEHIRSKRCPLGNPKMEFHTDGRHSHDHLHNTQTVHTDVLTLHGIENPEAGRYRETMRHPS